VSGLFTGAWIARPLHWANTFSGEQFKSFRHKKWATMVVAHFYCLDSTSVCNRCLASSQQIATVAELRFVVSSLSDAEVFAGMV
jgi:hypothetical protein